MKEIHAEFKHFAHKIMCRPNFFSFCASVYYTTGIRANYAMQIIISCIALLVISIHYSPTIALITGLVALIAIPLRKGCTSCGQLQGFMLIALSIGVASRTGAIAAILSTALFYAIFLAYYWAAKLVYDHSHHPQPMGQRKARLPGI